MDRELKRMTLHFAAEVERLLPSMLFSIEVAKM
jgi:hypothetical protein